MLHLKETLQAYQNNDPAARSKWEILLLYNGLHAILLYRLSHWLWGAHCRFLARFVSQIARWLTGVEIHPAAQIGRRLVIDHGTGIVVGATTVIGDDCLLYQGVTLGGTGVMQGKRHPTLGSNVMVGSGAKDVPENSTVVGVPGRVVRINGEKTDQVHIPDPVAKELQMLRERIEILENQLKEK